MPVDKSQPVSVTADRGAVALRVPIDGRLRTVRLDSIAALALANNMANTANRIAGPLTGMLDIVADVHIRPAANGGADLGFTTNHGPCLFHLPANVLLALSDAATAILALRDDAGTA